MLFIGKNPSRKINSIFFAVMISCSHFEFLIWTVTCRHLALRFIASKHAYFCANQVIISSSFWWHWTFVFDSWFSGHFVQNCFFLVYHMEILVSPTPGILFTHCAFEVTLSPVRFPAYWLLFKALPVLDHSNWTCVLVVTDRCLTCCAAFWCHGLCSIPNPAFQAPARDPHYTRLLWLFLLQFSFAAMSTAAAKISVSGAPIHVAFPPEPSHQFTVFYSKWLSQNYKICFSISKEAATWSSGKNAAKNQWMKELTSLRIMLFQIQRQAWSGADGQMDQSSRGKTPCRKAGKVNNQDRHLTFNNRVGWPYEFLYLFGIFWKRHCPKRIEGWHFSIEATLCIHTHIPTTPWQASTWPWLYPPSTPHSIRAAHLFHPSPKRACLWGVHWHRTGWRLVGCTLRFTFQTVYFVFSLWPHTCDMIYL